jgi:hypothetical protein
VSNHFHVFSFLAITNELSTQNLFFRFGYHKISQFTPMFLLVDVFLPVDVTRPLMGNPNSGKIACMIVLIGLI